MSQFYLAWVLPLIFEYKDVPEQCTPTDKGLPPAINLDEYEGTNQTYVIATVKGVPLFQEDLDCLSEGGEVTDNIIGVFMKYIKERFRGIEDLTIAQSFFYLSLTQDTALSGSFEENCRRASSYITSISPKDNLVIPICAYGHWFAIIIAQGHAIVMDSLSHIYDTITRDNEIDSICSYLKWQNHEMNINFERYIMRIPQQNNNTDCGVYLLLNVANFLSRWDAFVNGTAQFCAQDNRHWFGDEQVKQERKHMKNIIVNLPSFSASRQLRQ